MLAHRGVMRRHFSRQIPRHDGNRCEERKYIERRNGKVALKTLKRPNDRSAFNITNIKRSFPNPDMIYDEGAPSLQVTLVYTPPIELIDQDRHVVSIDQYYFDSADENGLLPTGSNDPYYSRSREHSPFGRYSSPPRHVYTVGNVFERLGDRNEDLRLELDIRREVSRRRYSPDRSSFELERLGDRNEDLRLELDIRREVSRRRYSPDRSSFELESRYSDFRVHNNGNPSNYFPRREERKVSCHYRYQGRIPPLQNGEEGIDLHSPHGRGSPPRQSGSPFGRGYGPRRGSYKGMSWGAPRGFRGSQDRPFYKY